MESLLFRNDQLTKRIGVLQQDLTTSAKKGKLKTNEIPSSNDIGLFNEELQKKIIENAQLLSTVGIQKCLYN